MSIQTKSVGSGDGSKLTTSTANYHQIPSALLLELRMVLNFGPPGPAPQVLGLKAYMTISGIFIYVGRVWVQAGMWSLEPTLQEAFPSLGPRDQVLRL